MKEILIDFRFEHLTERMKEAKSKTPQNVKEIAYLRRELYFAKKQIQNK